MRHDDEANLVIFDPEVVEVLDRHFDDDARRSTDLDPARWNDRSRLQKVAERVSGLVDRWM
jgi:cardiolipin synthase